MNLRPVPCGEGRNTGTSNALDHNACRKLFTSSGIVEAMSPLRLRQVDAAPGPALRMSDAVEPTTMPAGLLKARLPGGSAGAERGYGDLCPALIAAAGQAPEHAGAMVAHLLILEQLRLYASHRQRSRWFGEVERGRVLAGALCGKGMASRLPCTRLIKDGYSWRLERAEFKVSCSLRSAVIATVALTEDEAPALVLIPASRDGVVNVDHGESSTERPATIVIDNALVEDAEIVRLPADPTRRTPDGALSSLLQACVDTARAQVLLGEAAARKTAAAAAYAAPHMAALGQLAIMVSCSRLLVNNAAERLDHAFAALQAGRPYEQALGEASVAAAEAGINAYQSWLLAASDVADLVLHGGADAASWPYRPAQALRSQESLLGKMRAIGNYYVNGQLPPADAKI